MKHKYLGSREEKRKLIAEYITKNPSASNAMVIKDCRASQSLITKVRSDLRAAGIIGPNPNDRAAFSREMRKKFPPKVDPQITDATEVMIRGTAELMDLAAREGHLPNEAEIDPKEFLKTLTDFIRDSALPPPVRMAAMGQYTKIKSDLLGRDAIGPGDPLSVEDQIIRLSMLLKAVGMRTAVKAMEAAFQKLKETPNESTKVDKAEVIVGTTETPESPRHDDQVDESETLRGINISSSTGRDDIGYQD